jgi:hypothetical protein
MECYGDAGHAQPAWQHRMLESCFAEYAKALANGERMPQSISAALPLILLSPPKIMLFSKPRTMQHWAGHDAAA